MVDIDTILFDVDGTLVDSRKDIVKAVNFTLRKLGLPEKSPELIISYIGLGIRDLLKKSLGDQKINLTDKALKIFSEYFSKHCVDESRLYPHVKETLDYFGNKRKVVITNRNKESAEITLRKLGIRNYFQEIFGGDDEDCVKPSACPLDRVSSRLEMDKAKTIMVGDMDIDIRAGKNFGILSCWVAYGLGDREDIEKIEPDYIIDDIIKLKEIIKHENTGNKR